MAQTVVIKKFTLNEASDEFFEGHGINSESADICRLKLLQWSTNTGQKSDIIYFLR